MTLHLAQNYCGGVLPSLYNNRRKEIIAILVVMMVASTVAVAFRIAARKMSSAKYGLDDLFILIALVGHPLHLHFNVAKQSSRAEKQIRSRYLPME